MEHEARDGLGASLSVMVRGDISVVQQDVSHLIDHVPLDLGLPLPLLRGFALLARTAGLIGQLAEELRRPVANDIYLAVDRGAIPVPPEPWTPTRTGRPGSS